MHGTKLGPINGNPRAAGPWFYSCGIEIWKSGGRGSEFCDRTTTPLLSAECQIGQQTLTNPYTPSVTAINKKSTNRQQNFGNIMIKR
ncbi:hypothetical protein A4W76_10125 (plasmid) [Latilactobacillus curvatus]|nr:hypothetical protein A4W76_10125 [Latilactobacillus curvatus]